MWLGNWTPSSINRCLFLLSLFVCVPSFWIWPAGTIFQKRQRGFREYLDFLFPLLSSPLVETFLFSSIFFPLFSTFSFYPYMLKFSVFHQVVLLFSVCLLVCLVICPFLIFFIIYFINPSFLLNVFVPFHFVQSWNIWEVSTASATALL